jgi:hypothetical protein
VELGGVGGLHAAFLNESSTRGHVQRCVAGNPGPVEMTILFVIWIGGVMGLRVTQGDEKRLGPATTLCGTVAFSFVIPRTPRDLQFRGPLVEAWSLRVTQNSHLDRSDPDFLPRYLGQGHVCGFR